VWRRWTDAWLLIRAKVEVHGQHLMSPHLNQCPHPFRQQAQQAVCHRLHLLDLMEQGCALHGNKDDSI
jgi:hypothetical protein